MKIANLESEWAALAEFPECRLEKLLSACAGELAAFDRDVSEWHAWVEYLLYCLEEEALALDRRPAFESELVEIGTLIAHRIAHRSWCGGAEPPPSAAPNPSRSA